MRPMLYFSQQACNAVVQSKVGISKKLPRRHADPREQLAILVRQLRGEGKAVLALKPVVTGFDLKQTDPAILLDAMGEGFDANSVARIAPWRFAGPLSPDMAALRE